MKSVRQVLVTGGAGYVGAVLIPKLLNEGFSVKVLDLFIYGEDVFEGAADDPNLECIKGDIRDQDLLKRSSARGSKPASVAASFSTSM